MLLWSTWASTHCGHPHTPSAPHPACGVAEEGGLPWASLLRGAHPAVPAAGAVSSPGSREGCEAKCLDGAGNPVETRAPH